MAWKNPWLDNFKQAGEASALPLWGNNGLIDERNLELVILHYWNAGDNLHLRFCRGTDRFGWMGRRLEWGKGLTGLGRRIQTRTHKNREAARNSLLDFLFEYCSIWWIFWHYYDWKCIIVAHSAFDDSCKQGRSQGEGGKFPPPETEKIVVENGVISEGYF